MQTFVRMSKLSNIVGRSDYISNPKRQEDIVAARSYADWKPYQAYERTHQRSAKANNEGRELIIALPNEWQHLTELHLVSRMNELAQRLLPDKTDYQWAVHWNKDRTNLHMHLIFSERNRSYGSKGVWDRDIYLTDDGKVARRKADRARDKDGNVKPPVHRKGEPKADGKVQFTAKDTRYKSREWLEWTKQEVTQFYQQYGVTLDKPKLLHQQHVGKGDTAGQRYMKQKNERINRLNKWIKSLENHGFEFPSPPSADFRKMVDILMNTKTPLGISTAISIATKKPDFSYFMPSNPDIEKELRDKMIAEHISSWKGTDGKIIFFKEHLQRTKELHAAIKAEHAARRSAAAVPTQKPPEPKPEPDFQPLIAARNEYYKMAMLRETANTMSINFELLEYTNQLAAAIKALPEQARAVRDAYQAMEKCHFWQPKQKKQAAEQHKAAYDALDHTIDILYKADLPLSRPSIWCPKPEEIKKYGAAAQTALATYQQKAAEQQERQRVKSDAAQCSSETLQMLQNAFEQRCKEILPEHRTGAYEALKNAPTPSWGYSVQPNLLASARIRCEISEIMKKHGIVADDPTQREQQSHKQQPQLPKKNRGGMSR